MMNIKETLKNYLQKVPAFLSGLMFGTVLTGAFFILKINDYLIEFKEAIQSNMIFSENKNTNQPKNNKDKVKIKKYKSKTTEPKAIADENKNIKDNNEIFLQENDEASSIIEEKVISEKELKIIHLNHSSDTTFTGIAEVPTHLPENSIKIVFKKTPFNNKGYYYENNYIVLVGLQDIPYINLYEYKGELYIKYDKIIFKLPYTNSFQTLVKVNDEHIIAKMN